MQKLGHQLVTLPDETVLRIQAAALASASAMLEKDDMSPPGNRHLSRKSRHHGQSLRLRLPVSFCRRIWNCAVDRSLGGWGFRFETHNIRSNDAPVFSALKTRDLLGMRKMIAAGEASPFDCNADGASLLKVRALSQDQRYGSANHRLFPSWQVGPTTSRSCNTYSKTSFSQTLAKSLRGS